MTKLLIIAISITTIISCVPKTKYDELLKRNAELEHKLDECTNGAERIIAQVEKDYSENKFEEAKSGILKLSVKHPESPKNKDFKKLLADIETKIKKKEEKLKAEAAEKERLANLNNTGMWKIRRYVDSFGENTSQKYISNEDWIKGTFSNSATEDSKLNVRILIDSPTQVAIMLFEYAGENPVKAYGVDIYRILYQDSEGNRSYLRGENNSNRIRIDEDYARKVYNALLKGGTHKFYITESPETPTKYSFTINDAKYFNNAARLLKE